MRKLAKWLFLAGLLASASAAAEQPSSDAPQSVWATSLVTWIYPGPEPSEFPVGYLRPGAPVRLRGDADEHSAGCAGKFYPIEPRGYVCVDRNASLTRSRYSDVMRLASPVDRALPFRYALSTGTPAYSRLPTVEEWSDAERWFGNATRWTPSPGNPGHERLVVNQPIASDARPPPLLLVGGSSTRGARDKVSSKTVGRGSMVAYSQTFEHAGRTWLVSSDGTLVPGERVRPFRVTEFKGIELGHGIELPLAWVRRVARDRYFIDSDGEAVKAEGSWPARTAVSLTGVAAQTKGGVSLLETRELSSDGQGLWIREGDATVVKTRDLPAAEMESDEKWLWVSIGKGVLVAYVGSRPVFTTLISPGRGGIPTPGHDHVEASTTPLGVFRIGFKHLADDMGPEQPGQPGVRIAQVPYAQYFAPPFALHVAYWHEDFGEPMSGGCINVSPEDGRYLFGFTDPPLPAGWGGVQAGFGNPKGTLIVITR